MPYSENLVSEKHVFFQEEEKTASRTIFARRRLCFLIDLHVNLTRLNIHKYL